MIESEWEDLQQKNSPHYFFSRFSHYFQLNLDETCFLCYEGEIQVLGSKDKPAMTKIAVNQGFQ